MKRIIQLLTHPHTYEIHFDITTNSSRNSDELALKDWILNYLPTQMSQPEENYSWYTKIVDAIWDNKQQCIIDVSTVAVLNEAEYKEFCEFIGTIEHTAFEELRKCVNMGITGITLNNALDIITMCAQLNKDVRD